MFRKFFEHPLVKIFFTVLFTFIIFIGILMLIISFFGKGNYEENLATKKNSIGVIELKGIIRDSKNFLDQLEKFKKNKNIKAIVIKINSPGGAVVPSQEIYREILKTRKSKKIYAYMQSVAASGAYYVASACNKIIANPGTITGSIGVIIEFTNFEKLFNKLGINAVVVKSGKFKDVGNPFRPATDEDKKLLQTVINSIYNQFLSDVSKGRNIPLLQLKKIADGRIFTGTQALNLKLVDKLGNFSDLIALIKKEVKFNEEPEIVYIEKKKSFVEKFLDSSAKIFIKNITDTLMQMKFSFQ
jgi:protease-4